MTNKQGITDEAEADDAGAGDETFNRDVGGMEKHVTTGWWWFQTIPTSNSSSSSGGGGRSNNRQRFIIVAYRTNQKIIGDSCHNLVVVYF